jgi:serralysin
LGWHPSEDTVTVGVAKRPIRNVQSSFDGDGKLITDFGGGNGFVRTVIVQQDGKIVSAGQISSSTSPIQLALARYNPDGSLDTAFDGDGKLLVVVDAPP